MMDLKERCQRVVSEVLANNGWLLVGATDLAFLDEVHELVLKRDTTESELENVTRRATISVYCAYLYDAYHDDGSDRQAQAMGEVFRHVFRRLMLTARGDENLADVSANYAVEQAWLHWQDVRDSHSFLNFVLTIGIRAVWAAQKENDRNLEEGAEEDEAAPTLAQVAANENVEKTVEVSDMIQRVHRVVHHCLDRPEEIRIVFEHILGDKPYKELMHIWQKKASYLHLLKCRALKNLNKCQEFLELRREWLGTKANGEL
jgi:uncharacterized protein (DUF2267 family)